MTIAVLDATGGTAQVLSAAELTAALAAIPTAVNALATTDDAFAITPNDAADLGTVPKALLVTVAGTLAIRGVGGVTVSLGTVAAGFVVPIRARRVMATGTTATVVGLV